MICPVCGIAAGVGWGDSRGAGAAGRPALPPGPRVAACFRRSRAHGAGLGEGGLRAARGLPAAGAAADPEIAGGPLPGVAGGAGYLASIESNSISKMRQL